MGKEKFTVVKNEHERENEKLRLVADGYRVIMETDDQTIMEKKKRRTFLWILVFWPMIFLKVTKLHTIKVQPMEVHCIKCDALIEESGYCPQCGNKVSI